VSSGDSNAREAARQWARTQRIRSTSRDADVEQWFGTLGGIGSEVLEHLRLVRTDGSVALDEPADMRLFLRFDLFSGLVILLSKERTEKYGWSNALEEFTNPIWRQEQHPDPVSSWGRPVEFGRASAELAEALEQLLAAFRQPEGWEVVGRLLRRVFIQSCRELILVESELARLGDLEVPET
jgi:hypothetical protein